MLTAGRDLARWATGDIPTALERWIENPASRATIRDLPRESCAADDRIAWHWWKDAHAVSCQCQRTQPGQVLGWEPRSNGEYMLRQHHLEALAALVRQESVDEWIGDISDVAGVSSSKSPLSEYDSLDAMIQARRPELVSARDPASIYHLLTHDEVRILNVESRADFFSLHMWDGRIFLCNSGGSHHFSAARYLAAQFGVKIPLRGRIYRQWIDGAALSALRSAHSIYAIDSAPSVRNALHEALEAFRAPYLLHRLPNGLSTRTIDEGGAYAVFLPRAHARSARVASAMAQAGFFDVGDHLEILFRRQAQLGSWVMPVDRRGGVPG